MSASEQMRAMLDQLMGTARNGKHGQSVEDHIRRQFLMASTMGRHILNFVLGGRAGNVMRGGSLANLVIQAWPFTVTPPG